jgi:hypothetical protein
MMEMCGRYAAGIKLVHNRYPFQLPQREAEAPHRQKHWNHPKRWILNEAIIAATLGRWEE